MHYLGGDVEIGTTPSMDAFLFYLVCDTSSSMYRFTSEHKANDLFPPGELLGPAIKDMGEALSSNFEINSQGYLCIIAFNDEPKIVQETRRFNELQLGRPQMPRGTFTNYAKAWRFIGDAIRNDIQTLTAANKRLYRPVLFFLTDGIPETEAGRQTQSQWKAEYDRAISQIPEEFRPRIIALGFNKADAEVLRALHSTRPRHGRALIARDVSHVNSIIPDLIIAIKNSIANSATGASFDFTAPPTMTDLCTSGNCS